MKLGKKVISGVLSGVMVVSAGSAFAAGYTDGDVSVYESNESIATPSPEELAGYTIGYDKNRIVENIPISLDYDEVVYMSDGIARVKNGEKYSYVDINNETVDINSQVNHNFDIGPMIKYDEATEKSGYVNATGEWVISPQYYHCGDFSEGLARVLTADGFVYIDVNGDVKISGNYADAGNFNAGYAPVALNIKSESSPQPSEWAVIDKKGKQIFTMQCDYMYDYSDALFLVNKNGEFSFVDINGNSYFDDKKFDNASSFKYEIALVSENGKLGYINRKGKYIIKPEYDTATEFTNGYAWVSKDGKYGVLKDEEYSAINELVSLNILTGDTDGSLRLSENITRAEFAAIACRFCGLTGAISQRETNFSDVNSDYWASGYIADLSDRGVINGYEDGTFLPDNTITVEEAGKIICDILGYAPFAEVNGGYPTGYKTLFKSINILGTKTGDTSAMCERGKAIKMLATALDIPMMEKTVYDGDNSSYTIMNGQDGLPLHTIRNTCFGE